jgi:hypothetical protein
MRPEASEDAAKTSLPRPASPVPSGADKSPSSLRGGNTSSGRVAPNPPDLRAEEEFISSLEPQDTGASNMGAGTENIGRSEPLVPPVHDKKKKKATTSSPPKARPAAPSPA